VHKGWQKRWCVLQEGRLLYFRIPEDAKPINYIPLEHASVKVWPHSTDWLSYNVINLVGIDIGDGGVLGRQVKRMMADRIALRS
jgi:hypothetical protein